jgi:hypothetical protein
MKVLKRLFFGATLAAVSLLPLASQSDAQQRFCPRNMNVITIQKQTQTTQYFQQQQQYQDTMRLQQQQQQNRLIEQTQRQQQMTMKTSTQTQTTVTPIQKTVTTIQPKITQQIQHETQVINKTDQIVNRSPGLVCNKTTPQLLTTQQSIQKTSTASNVTMTATQCTHLQAKITQQKTQKTQLAMNTSTTQIKRTETAIKKTDLEVHKTYLDIQKTPLTTNTITTTEVIHLNINCMQCHHPSQPTMVAKGPQHQPPTMLHQRFPPGPVAIGKIPPAVKLPQFLQPPAVALPRIIAPPLETWPQMVVKQPALPVAMQPPSWRPKPLPQAILYPAPQPLPALVGRSQPLPTFLAKMDNDLPSFLRTGKSKMDPMLVTALAKEPAGPVALPALIADPSPEGMLRTAAYITSKDLIEQPLYAGPVVDTTPVEMLAPLSEDELQQPPVRKLVAAVLQLSTLPVLSEKVLVEEEELLPPSLEPGSSQGDLFDQFTPVQPAAPRVSVPAPALQEPGLPTARETDLMPG